MSFCSVLTATKRSHVTYSISSTIESRLSSAQVMVMTTGTDWWKRKRRTTPTEATTTTMVTDSTNHQPGWSTRMVVVFVSRTHTILWHVCVVVCCCCCAFFVIVFSSSLSLYCSIPRMDNDDGDGDGDDNEDEPRSGNTTQLYIDTVFEEVTAVAVALAVAVAVAVAVMYQQSSSSYMYVRTVYIYSQYHACALPDESNRIESNRVEWRIESVELQDKSESSRVNRIESWGGILKRNKIKMCYCNTLR